MAVSFMPISKPPANGVAGLLAVVLSLISPQTLSYYSSLDVSIGTTRESPTHSTNMAESGVL